VSFESVTQKIEFIRISLTWKGKKKETFQTVGDKEKQKWTTVLANT